MPLGETGWGAGGRGTVRRRVEGRKGSVLGFDQQPGLSSPKYQLWAGGASPGWIFMARVLTPAGTAHPQVTLGAAVQSCYSAFLSRAPVRKEEVAWDKLASLERYFLVLFSFFWVFLLASVFYQ